MTTTPATPPVDMAEVGEMVRDMVEAAKYEGRKEVLLEAKRLVSALQMQATKTKNIYNIGENAKKHVEGQIAALEGMTDWIDDALPDVEAAD